MNHEPVQVIPLSNYTVLVYFDDGKIVSYDAAPILKKEAFLPLQDISLFMSSCTIMNGTLAWDLSGKHDPADCLDIDPDTIYNLDEIVLSEEQEAASISEMMAALA